MIHFSIAPEFDKMDLVLEATGRPHRAYAVRYDDKTRVLTFFLGGTKTMEIDDLHFLGLDCRVLKMQGRGYKLLINDEGWRVQTLVESAAAYPELIRINE